MQSGPNERHVSFLQHLQGEQEFLAELLLAPSEIGLRRERADCAVRQRRGAVIRLAAPDCQHDRAGDAEALLDFGKRRAMLPGERAALRSEAVECGLLQVFGRRFVTPLKIRAQPLRSCRHVVCMRVDAKSRP